MAKSPRVEVAIAGDPSGLNKAFRSSASAGSRFGRAIAGVGKMAAIGLAAAGAAAVVTGKALFDTATSIEAVERKAATVFEGSLGDVQAWAEETAHAMGLTTTEATGLAANFADLLKPMGFTADQAADMATEVVGLSGALSEWSGGQVSSAEASDILAKAMLGERESLKTLGISIKEADVQARLAAKGQDELTGAALEQAKAIATQELIFEKSTDAQKAYERGGRTLARRQAVLKAKFKELRDRIAKALIPVFEQLATFAADKLIPALDVMGEWLGVNLPRAIDWMKARFEAIRPTLQRIAEWLGDNVPRAMESLKSKWEEVRPAVQRGFRLAGDAAKILWEEGLQPMAQWARRAFDRLEELANKIADYVGPKIDDLSTEVEDNGSQWDKWKEDLQPVTGWVTDDLLPVLESIYTTMSNVGLGILYSIKFILDTFGQLGLGIAQAVGFVGSQMLKLGLSVATGIKWAYTVMSTVGLSIIYAIQAIGRAIQELPRVFSIAWAGVKATMAGLGSFLWNNTGLGWFYNRIRDLISLVDSVKSKLGALKDLNPFDGSFLGVDLFAHGGTMRRDGLAVVGERGPELVALPGGAEVIPNHRIVTGGGGGPIVVNVSGSVLSERDLMQAIRTAMRQGHRVG